MRIGKAIKNQRGVICLLGAICLWLLLIFFLSTQNGPETANTSEGMASVIAKIIYGTPDAIQVDYVHSEIRRLAHVVLFFILGSMIGLVCVKVRTRIPVWFRFLAGYGFLLFCSFFDEWHKQFISGRHNQFKDALLNVRGCTIGLGIIVVIYLLKKLRDAIM
ncbi:MAG: VanZ family protein [bacterium]|nr:VanZ family protein [bacterium]